ncbi:excisionase family DNA-binding protein [Deinococcus sp. PEB2-63]
MTVANRPKAGQSAAYTPEECRPLLKLGRDKVYELIRSGQLRSVRVGRRYLIPADAVTAFLRGGQ